MIGKITIGKSFSGCIAYCLEDKIDKHSLAVSFKNRAEVLFGNYCYGAKEELINQFNAVRALNRRVEKPVMHLTLSLAPSEVLEREKLMELVYETAKELNFEKNQFLAVSHLDTGHQHVHMVVNRVGYDGKTLKDSNNYGKVAACCRKLELKYGLQQVLSPRRYLSNEQRQLPRQDMRKEAVKQHINDALTTCKSFEAFEQQMKAKGYWVLKGRGISFIDDKGVKIKGSEVGYPLRKLEQVLGQKQGTGQQSAPKPGQKVGNSGRPFHPSQTPKEHHIQNGESPKGNLLDQAATATLKSERVPDEPNPKWGQKKKKRKHQSIHH